MRNCVTLSLDVEGAEEYEGSLMVRNGCLTDTSCATCVAAA
jgi:hypothetical protein